MVNNPDKPYALPSPFLAQVAEKWQNTKLINRLSVMGTQRIEGKMQFTLSIVSLSLPISCHFLFAAILYFSLNSWEMTVFLPTLLARSHSIWQGTISHGCCEITGISGFVNWVTASCLQWSECLTAKLYQTFFSFLYYLLWKSVSFII